MVNTLDSPQQQSRLQPKVRKKRFLFLQPSYLESTPALSVCVFMTQKNWRDVALREEAEGTDKPLGLVHQLAKAKAE